MCPSFHAAVSALVYSIVRERCPGGLERPPFLGNRLARFVLRSAAGMPDFLRAGLVAATLLLDSLPLLTAGRPFHGLEPEQRGRILARWRSSRLSPLRELLRFYESLTVYGWHAVRHERTPGI